MLNRFRDFVKRLELPQEEEGEVVYRIIDDDLNAVEVTAAQYGIWRLQHDVTKRAIVGQDSVESVMVRTTFSIMPENRGYKPFGTSAYEVSTFEPLTQYTQRYDTWQEAEQGTPEHAGTDKAGQRHGTRDRPASGSPGRHCRSGQASGIGGYASSVRGKCPLRRPTLMCRRP